MKGFRFRTKLRCRWNTSKISLIKYWRKLKQRLAVSSISNYQLSLLFLCISCNVSYENLIVHQSNLLKQQSFSELPSIRTIAQTNYCSHEVTRVRPECSSPFLVFGILLVKTCSNQRDCESQVAHQSWSLSPFL